MADGNNIMKLLKSPGFYLASYFAMITITYGHAWKTIVPHSTDGGAALFATIWSSFVWPLYWSVQLWK